MRRDDLIEATVAVMARAQTVLPSWVRDSIRSALDQESNPLARFHLQAILENLDRAMAHWVPICQDTGVPIFHIFLGREARLDFSLRDALSRGVALATEAIPLRPNVVHPLSRANSGDNTGLRMPYLMVDAVEGKEIRLTYLPKGAGSENMSLVSMLNPADDPMEYVVRTVAERAANACPPIFLGVGLGGTFDQAAYLAKRALMELPGREPLDLELLDRVNTLGIGPMGLGGDTTALGVRVEMAGCHTASLPVALNMQCWAHRIATVVVDERGWRLEDEKWRMV